MLLVEVRGETVAHHLLVGVEPVDLFRLHHLFHDRGGENRAEGELLKLIIRSEGESFSGVARSLIAWHGVAVVAFAPQARVDHEHSVLVPHSVAAGDIDARLAGDGHARNEPCRHIVHAELMRTLMHVEVRAHAMTGAVEVVDSVFPHRGAGQRVELAAVGATREDSAGEVDKAAQHERVVAPLLVGERTQRDGAGDVGGAVEILTTRVNQQQTHRLHRYVGVGRRLVMHDGTMVAIAHDGVETLAFVERLLFAERDELLLQRELRMSAFANSGNHPFHPFHHGDAVFQMGVVITADLCLVLHNLHRAHRAVAMSDDTALDGVLNSDICLVGLQEDAPVVVAEILGKTVVFHQLHTLCLQVVTHFRAHFPAVHEEDGLTAGDEEVRHEHWVVVHVGAAQVERPGHFVEHGDHDGVGSLGGYCLTNPANLALSFLASKTQRMNLHRVERYLGAVFPNLIVRVVHRLDADAEAVQTHMQLVDAFDDIAPAVHADLVVAAQALRQPLSYRRGAFQTEAHQLEITVFQLLLCLQKIAVVGPKGSMTECHDSGAGGAGETGDPLAAIPVARHILSAMRVGARGYKCL